MKTTKILTLITCGILIASSVNAQRAGMKRGLKGMSAEERKEKKEEIEALKITYITDQVVLTTEEAKLFWPIYNDHEKDVLELRRSLKDKNHKSDEKQPLTEEEASIKLKNSVTHKENELNLYKDYISELRTAIPATKIIKLQQAERGFKRELLKKIRQGKKEE